MAWTKDHVWTIELKLPPGPLEYKYLLRSASDIRWEDGSNHYVLLQPKSRVCITDFWQVNPQHRLLGAIPVVHLPKVGSLLRLHKTEMLDDRDED